MERRDYLEIQIEQLGRVLSKLISGFLGIKNQSVSNEILEQTNSSLNEYFGFDLSDLSKLSNQDFIRIIQNNRSFNIENLDKLSNFIELLAEIKPENEKIILLEKSLAIIDYIDKKESIYSLERQMKKVKINNNLDLLLKN